VLPVWSGLVYLLLIVTSGLYRYFTPFIQLGLDVVPGICIFEQFSRFISPTTIRCVNTPGGPCPSAVRPGTGPCGACPVYSITIPPFAEDRLFTRSLALVE